MRNPSLHANLLTALLQRAAPMPGTTGISYGNINMGNGTEDEIRNDYYNYLMSMVKQGLNIPGSTLSQSLPGIK